MNHIRIVLSLLVVVVLMSVAVFLVEDQFRPLIDEAAATRANEAKVEVLPAAADYVGSPTNALEDGYDAGDTGITGIFYFEGYGYVYQVEFQGHVDTVEYMFGFDESGNVTGYKTLNQKETAGLGAKIADPQYWTQFLDKTTDDLAAGDIDGWVGATSTSEKWQASFVKVIAFHNNVFLGYEYTDVTGSHGLGDYTDGDNSSILSVVEVSKDGVAIQYEYTVEFTGYSETPSNTFVVVIDATNGNIKSVKLTEVNDSADIGALIGESEFAAQFPGLTQEQVLNQEYDEIGGATYPLTFKSFDSALQATYLQYRIQVEGFVPYVESDAERLARYYVELSNEDVVLQDVTGNFDLTNSPVTKVEIYETYMFFTFEFTGYNTTEGKGVTLLVGIDRATDNLTGLRALDQHETDGLGAKIATEAYQEQFTGMDYFLPYLGGFDAISGATVTTDGLRLALSEVFDFYRTEVLDRDSLLDEEPAFRPLATPADQEDLDAVFGTADDFNSIYDNLDEAVIPDAGSRTYSILNVYEVHDATDTVIGYVYYGKMTGTYTSIEFTWGVDITGETTVVNIINDNTSWNFAPYTGGEVFPETETFTDLFEGVQIQSILDTQVNIDAWSGVSTTTGNLRSFFEAIAQYHVDTLGGGN